MAEPGAQWRGVCRILTVPITLATSFAYAEVVIVPDDFSTLPAAVEAVGRNGDPSNTILVEPGTYSVNLALISNLVLRGRETSRTFLIIRGDPQATTIESAVSITGVNNVQVSNFTFLSGDGSQNGITIEASANIRISNNVFRMGTEGTGVSVTTSPSVTIENNTFVSNDTALSRAGEEVVRNNIFQNNDTAIFPANIDTNVSFNGFFANTVDGARGAEAVTDSAAAFVDPENNDFHLSEDSPAIDAGFGTDIIDGTGADLGAFGGVDADRRPFPVQNLAVSAVTDSSVTLSWDRNLSYLVTNADDPGGYRVYYGTQSNTYTGTGAQEGSSPIDVGDVESFTLSGLAGAAEPTAPTDLTTSPADGVVHLRWSPVAGATGYRIHYGVASTAERSVDVGNVTSFDLKGLVNGTTYRISVSALAQARIFLAVAARDNTAAQNESALVEEVEALVGPVQESPLSEEVADFPERLVARPELPDEGCFIATAAFGFYDAPQVQALRDFRDRFLLTRPDGRLLVRGYYRYSPAAARWLNFHPRYKPLVRAALLPAVVVSMASTGRLSPWFEMVLLGTLVLNYRRAPQRLARGASQ